MKVDELFETPQYTFPQDFGLSDEIINRKEAQSLLNKPKTPVESIGDYTLYEFSRAYALISNEAPEIAYIVKFQYDFVKFLNRKCVSQVLVWRNNNVPETRDLATRIFFDHILPKTKTVITDLHQTDDGKRFWENRVQDAFRLGYNVYYVSLVPNRELIRINTVKDFITMSKNKKVWGDLPVNQAKKIIITTEQFDQ